MAKVIKDFKIDFSSVPTNGATRSFSVEGDNGAIFSIQVKSPLGTYYDFTTNTFTATGTGLKRTIFSWINCVSRDGWWYYSETI